MPLVLRQHCLPSIVVAKKESCSIFLTVKENITETVQLNYLSPNANTPLKMKFEVSCKSPPSLLEWKGLNLQIHPPAAVSGGYHSSYMKILNFSRAYKIIFTLKRKKQKTMWNTIIFNYKIKKLCFKSIQLFHFIHCNSTGLIIYKLCLK